MERLSDQRIRGQIAVLELAAKNAEASRALLSVEDIERLGKIQARLDELRRQLLPVHLHDRP